MVGKFLTDRFEVKASDGSDAIIKRDFYKETSSKHQDDPLYPVKLEYARNAHNLFENAHYVRPEVSIDHLLNVRMAAIVLNSKSEKIQMVISFISCGYIKNKNEFSVASPVCLM